MDQVVAWVWIDCGRWVWIVEIGGFGSVEVGGFLVLDRCYVCGSVLWVWIGAIVVRCCGFGSVLLWPCLVIVVVGGFWQFFVFLFLLVVISCGCCWK